jgi:hypothetical protein
MKLAGLIKTCLNETYSKGQIGYHLSDMFPIQMVQNKGMLHCHCFSTLF